MIIKNVYLYNPERKIYVKSNLLIQKGKIVEDKLPIEFLPEKEEVIDLSGKYIYPSFIDSHCHLLGTGKSIIQKNLEHITDKNDLIVYLKKNECKLTVLRGWDDKKLGFIPNRSFLDKTNPHNSILFIRKCGHIGTVNTHCIQELSLGALHGVDGSNLDLGILYERALISATRKIISTKSEEQAYFNLGSKQYIDNGITAVHSEDWNINTIYKIIPFLNTQKSIRLSEAICIANIEELISWIALKNKINSSFFINTHFIKIYLDGSLGGETAYLKYPYENKDKLGTLYYSEQELIELLSLAESENISVKVHVIGDGALEVALNAFSKTISSDNPLRHKLVHVQLASIEQLKRIRDLNLYVSIQPSFLISDRTFAPLILGKKRFYEIGYPYHKMGELGIKISFSSDSPIETLNPFITLKSSDEWLDRKTAFNYYCSESARSMFLENCLGSITKGKLADFFIMSKDIFSIPTECLNNITPELVMFDGEWNKG